MSHRLAPSSQTEPDPRPFLAPSGTVISPSGPVLPAAPDELLSLHAGPYHLTLVADRGSQRGASATGSLTLARASAEDESRTPGELARDFDGTPAFYGWAALDFGRVAAPLCKGPPAANSRDPARPGVLVPRRLFRGQQIILIGTMWNIRDGAEYRDGCGVILLVESWKGNCCSGTWDRFGISGNGAGSFRACRVVN